MYKSAFLLAVGLLISSVTIAKPLNSYAVLNGDYVGNGAPKYSFDSTRESGISQGQACQYSGKLSQPNKNKLLFIYKNTSSDGSVPSCEIKKPLNITVISTDPKTGIATKIKVTGDKRDKSFTGIFEKLDN